MKRDLKFEFKIYQENFDLHLFGFEFNQFELLVIFIRDIIVHGIKLQINMMI